MTLKEWQEKRTAALMKAGAICDEAEKAGREFTEDERKQITGYMTEAKEAKDQLAKLEGDEALRKEIQTLGAGLIKGPVAAHLTGKGSIGEQFVNAPEIKEWLASFPGGQIPESYKGLRSPALEFKSFFGRKTLITGDSVTSAGAFVQTDYTNLYEPMGRMPLVLRDLISKRTTQSDVVEFVQQTAKVTQAATVAEANVTTYAGTTGQVSGIKPEGAMAFKKVQETVKTIAVWVPATKRALSDVGQMRGIIDQELRADLDEELEDQLLNGDGSGENMTGILNTSGILTQAWDTDLFTTTRKALTTLRTTGKTIATAWVVNPTDMETIDLLKDGENRYYYGGPLREGPRTLWGKPVVESETKAQGTALLGNFEKAVLWDRERATLQVSDSHEDFFIRNMVAFLAEMRAAFGVLRPSAFIEVEMEAGT